MTNYLDTRPHPWSKGDIETAIFRDFSDAKLAINRTEGARLWADLADLCDSCWILDSSTRDLLDEICLFGDRSRDPNFWHETNAIAAAEHTRQVKKKVFQCTSAVMALVDHARKFQKSHPVPYYSSQLTKAFQPPGFHDFLQCLRNYSTHWRIASTDWHIEHKFNPPSRTAKFLIARASLLRWDKWTVPAADFIEKSTGDFDVYDLFSRYNKLAQNFYAWHKGSVIDHYAPVLQPYFLYKKHYDGCMRRTSWNLVVSHVPKDANPFQYLDRVLSPADLESLLAEPHRSPEQVDKLIGLVDKLAFCDDSLRAKLLSLFQRK